MHLLPAAGISVVNQDFLSNPKLPYCDNSFDLVTCFDVVEHLPSHPLRLLSEIRRVLKENGTLVLGVPNAVSLAKRIKLFMGRHPYMAFDLWCKDEYYQHYREYTPGEAVWAWASVRPVACEVETVPEPSSTMARHNFWKVHYDGYSPRAVFTRLALRAKYCVERLCPGLRQTVYCSASAPAKQAVRANPCLAADGTGSPHAHLRSS